MLGKEGKKKGRKEGREEGREGGWKEGREGGREEGHRRVATLNTTHLDLEWNCRVSHWLRVARAEEGQTLLTLTPKCRSMKSRFSGLRLGWLWVQLSLQSPQQIQIEATSTDAA